MSATYFFAKVYIYASGGALGGGLVRLVIKHDAVAYIDLAVGGLMVLGVLAGMTYAFEGRR